MNRLKSVFGYSWAVLALIIAFATYIGNEAFSRVLASSTGVIVSPWFSGGEIIRSIDHGSYQTNIHRPVFDSLLGRRRIGFVQVNWTPAAGLPKTIREEIDYNKNGKVDFIITLDTGTGKAGLEGTDPSVLSLERIYHLRDGWAARIKLRRLPE